MSFVDNRLLLIVPDIFGLALLDSMHTQRDTLGKKKELVKTYK
jgi:hypothetical protein